MADYREDLVLIQHMTTLTFFVLPNEDWRTFDYDTGEQWHLITDKLRPVEIDEFECARMQGIYRHEYQESQHKTKTQIVAEMMQEHPLKFASEMRIATQEPEDILGLPSGFEDAPLFLDEFAKPEQGEMFPRNRVTPLREAIEKINALKRKHFGSNNETD